MIRDYIHPSWWAWWERRQQRKFHREIEREIAQQRWDKPIKAPDWIKKPGNRRPLHTALYVGNNRVVSGNTVLARELPAPPPAEVGKFTRVEYNPHGNEFIYRQENGRQIKGYMSSDPSGHMYYVYCNYNDKRFSFLGTTREAAILRFKEWIDNECPAVDR